MKEFVKIVKNEKNVGKLIRHFISSEKFKPYSKEIPKLIPRLLKNNMKLPDYILDQKSETEAILQSKDKLENELNCGIEIIKAEESEDNKAMQAMPGKPAILVE